MIINVPVINDLQDNQKPVTAVSPESISKHGVGRGAISPVFYGDGVPYTPVPFRLHETVPSKLLSSVVLDVPGLPYLVTNPSDMLTIVVAEVIPSVYQKSLDLNWRNRYYSDREFFMEEIAEIIDDSSISARCIDNCQCDVTHSTCSHCLTNLPLIEEAKETAYMLMDGLHLPLNHMVPWQSDMTYKVFIVDPNTVQMEIYGRF